MGKFDEKPSVSDVTIVIPAFNAADSISATLAALHAQTFDGDISVIVVDDGSTDDTATIALQDGATVLRQDNAGPAAARNNGAAEVKSPITIFTDADCVPLPNFVSALVDRLDAPDQPDVAMGSYVSTTGTLISRLAQLEFEHRYSRLSLTQPIDFAATYATAIRSEVFDESGGFDVSFEHPDHEDLDLAWRLAAKGARIVFEPRAQVDHEHATSARDYVRTKLRRGSGRLTTIRRHPAKAVHDDYTPHELKLQVALAAAMPLLLACRSTSPGHTGLRLATVAGLVSTAPLMRQAAQSDPALIPLVPLFSFARAASLACGLAAESLGLGKHLW